MPPVHVHEPSPARPWEPPSSIKIYGTFIAIFTWLGVWLAFDLKQEYEKALTDTSHRAMQRSLIISQTFRTKVLATDYVLRDVLGRIREQDLVYPNHDADQAQSVTRLLKEKADTVPDFFSMVIFNHDCVFTATATGENTGVRSKHELCEARKAHQGAGPMASYVSGKKSASGQSVLVLSRHLLSAQGHFLGGVLGVIELERAQHLFDSLDLGPGDSVTLLDEDQVVLARHPVLTGVVEKHADTFNASAALTAAGSGPHITDRLDIDGRQRLFGFSKIEGFPFVVAYGFDKISAVAQWQRRAMELTAGYFTLLLLAGLVARAHWTTLRQREELRSSEAHFRMLAENMADIVWKTDARMRFTYISSADQKLRGFARDEVIGTTVRDNLTPQGQALFDKAVQQNAGMNLQPKNGQVQKYEWPMRHKNQSEIWIEMTSVPIYGSDGHVNGFQGMGRDITGRRQHEATLLESHHQLEAQLQAAAEEKSVLQELATRDALTGLYNRRFLDAALSRELARSTRDGKPLAAIMIDLDHFKNVNDQYGHAAGDEVLVALAELLKRGARESDLICRHGGEEFVVIMPNMSANQALDRVESWRKQLEQTRVVYGKFQIAITLSAGIAVFPDHGDNPSQLLANADHMLYRSKESGRNRISVCTLEQGASSSNF